MIMTPKDYFKLIENLSSSESSVLVFKKKLVRYVGVGSEFVVYGLCGYDCLTGSFFYDLTTNVVKVPKSKDSGVRSFLGRAGYTAFTLDVLPSLWINI